MTNNQIRDLVNTFCRTTKRFAGGIDLKGLQILLLRYSDGWGLVVVKKRQKWDGEGVEKLRLDFPDLPEDDLGRIIDLAGFLSVRLKNYFRISKSNAGRTAESQRLAAQKSANARWKKQRN